MLIFFNDAHKDKVCGYAGGYGAARIQIPKEIEPGVQFELMQSRCQLDLKPSVWQLQRTTEHKVPDQLISQFIAPSPFFCNSERLSLTGRGQSQKTASRRKASPECQT